MFLADPAQAGTQVAFLHLQVRSSENILHHSSENEGKTPCLLLLS